MIPIGSHVTDFYMQDHQPCAVVVPVLAFRSFISLTELARLIVAWKNGKLLEDMKEILLHCLQPSCIMFQHFTMRAMGIHRALALVGDAKQAMGEEKSGPVETGLTGLVTMFLLLSILVC